MPPPPFRLSALATRTPEQPISHFMKVALENRGLINLAAGFVDENRAIDVSGVFVPIIALDGTFIPSHTPSGYVVRLWPCATDSTNGATP